MNHLIGYYVWVGSLCFYVSVLGLYYMIPVKAFLLGELTSYLVLASFFAMLSLGSLSYVAVAYCNENRSLISQKWLFPVWLLPFLLPVLLIVIFRLVI